MITSTYYVAIDRFSLAYLRICEDTDICSKRGIKFLCLERASGVELSRWILWAPPGSCDYLTSVIRNISKKFCGSAKGSCVKRIFKGCFIEVNEYLHCYLSLSLSLPSSACTASHFYPFLCERDDVHLSFQKTWIHSYPRALSLYEWVP